MRSKLSNQNKKSYKVIDEKPFLAFSDVLNITCKIYFGYDQIQVHSIEFDEKNRMIYKIVRVRC